MKALQLLLAVALMLKAEVTLGDCALMFDGCNKDGRGGQRCWYREVRCSLSDTCNTANTYWSCGTNGTPLCSEVDLGEVVNQGTCQPVACNATSCAEGYQCLVDVSSPLK